MKINNLSLVKYKLLKLSIVLALTSIFTFFYRKDVFIEENDMLFSSILADSYLILLFITLIVLIFTAIVFFMEIFVKFKK